MLSSRKLIMVKGKRGEMKPKFRARLRCLTTDRYVPFAIQQSIGFAKREKRPNSPALLILYRVLRKTSNL